MPRKSKIDLLNAINPSNAGLGASVLMYDRINPAFQEYKYARRQIYSNFLKTMPDSIEEDEAVNDIEDAELLRSSYMAIHSHRNDRNKWAERFTQISRKLYGEPDPSLATSLLTEELRFAKSLINDQYVSQKAVKLLIDTFSPIVETGLKNYGYYSAPIISDHATYAIRHYGSFVQRRYRPIFDLVDLSNKASFSTRDLFVLFDSALNWMKQNDDPDWCKWKVVISNGTSVYVVVRKKQINIGSRRGRVTIQEAKGLLAHELLVHAMRGKNGYKTGNRMLAIGLPGYLHSEEGLGVLHEMAVNNNLPDKARDRYLDIALALGTIDGVERPRSQLFRLTYARHLTRAQALNHDPQVINDIKPRVWAHIDRIYRGGKGFGRASQQAVFTKDIIYFDGFIAMSDYIVRRIYKGDLPEVIFNYLSSAKFDPNNPRHTRLISQDIDNYVQ